MNPVSTKVAGGLTVAALPALGPILAPAVPILAIGVVVGGCALVGAFIAGSSHIEDIVNK